jgi:hypothetical protein
MKIEVTIVRSSPSGVVITFSSARREAAARRTRRNQTWFGATRKASGWRSRNTTRHKAATNVKETNARVRAGKAPNAATAPPRNIPPTQRGRDELSASFGGEPPGALPGQAITSGIRLAQPTTGASATLQSPFLSVYVAPALVNYH